MCILFYSEVPDTGEPYPHVDLECYIFNSIFLHMSLWPHGVIDTHMYPSAHPAPVPMLAKDVDALVMVVGVCRERGEGRSARCPWAWMVGPFGDSGCPLHCPAVHCGASTCSHSATCGITWEEGDRDLKKS